MVKKCTYILIILMLLFTLTGCYSSDEKKLAKQYREQGKINAINYVKEKYGFNPKVTSAQERVHLDPLFFWDDSPGEECTIKLNYNNRDFFVYVSGKEESSDAIDDYQMDEINRDVIEFLKNNISIELYDYKLEFNSKGIKEYYEGNLDSMLSYITNIELYYVGDNDLNEVSLDKIEDFLNKYNGTLNLINFKTNDQCNEYKSAKLENFAISHENMKDIYKDNSLKVYQGERTFYNYNNLSSYNDEVYVYSVEDENNYIISASELDDINNYRKLYDDLSDKKIEQVTKAYSIPSNSSYLYIYFPKDKVDAKEYENMFLVSEYYVGGEKEYHLYSYYGLESHIKMGRMGKYYLDTARYSLADADSKIVFALVRIKN